MDFGAETQKETRKIYKKVLLMFVVWGLLFAGLIGYGRYWLFYDSSRFKQNLIGESTSPDGTYTINAHLSDGGATTSYTVLGELIFNNENKRSKKIYWQSKESTARIEWIDDDTVKINTITLELPHETYDYRKGIQ